MHIGIGLEDTLTDRIILDDRIITKFIGFFSGEIGYIGPINVGWIQQVDQLLNTPQIIHLLAFKQIRVF